MFGQSKPVKRSRDVDDDGAPTSNKTKKKPLSQKEQLAKKKEIIDKKLLTEPTKGCENKMIKIANAILQNPDQYSLTISSDQIASINIKSKWPLSLLGPGFAVRG